MVETRYGPARLSSNCGANNVPQVVHGDDEIGLMGDVFELGDEVASEDGAEAGAVGHGGSPLLRG